MIPTNTQQNQQIFIECPECGSNIEVSIDFPKCVCPLCVAMESKQCMCDVCDINTCKFKINHQCRFNKLNLEVIE